MEVHERVNDFVLHVFYCTPFSLAFEPQIPQIFLIPQTVDGYWLVPFV